MHDTLFIFFISGARLRRKMSWRTRIRMLRRWPGKSYSMFLARTTMFLTRSDLCHCSVGYCGVVLDPLIGGNRYWGLADYVARRAGAITEYAMQVSRPTSLAGFPDRKKAVLPSLIRYLTRGRFRFTHDCVSVTICVMERAGIKVPKNIGSPKQLRDWVEKHAKYSTI